MEILRLGTRIPPLLDMTPTDSLHPCPSPLFAIPDPPANFTGRADELNELLTDFANGVTISEPRRAMEFYEQYLTIAREIGDQRSETNAC